jgi:hypothetical protein
MLHPFLGYLLDSDGVAYLTIARRVAEGHYVESINGLWSPLNSWLLVPFIQKGMNAWEVAKVMNVVFGGIVIGLSNFLFIRFRLGTWSRFCLLLSLAIVMAHNVYFQMFGDVLQLIFVLIYLLVLWSEHFINSYWKTFLCAAIMGIGFYAKAYSLVFFLFHFAISLYWFYKTNRTELAKAIRLYAFGVFTIFLFILPWTFALHKKYGEWSVTGHAGKLNMSWQLNSGKSFRQDIKLLIPPVYSDSPSFWEDPYPSQQHLSTPFSSPKYFIKWMARITHTTLVAVACFNEISFLSIAILLTALYVFFFRKKTEENKDIQFELQLLILTILVLPLGYLMMHIETRYIWLTVFLLMIAGALLLERMKNSLRPAYYVVSIILLAFSFIVFPVFNMENLKYKNKDLFERATELSTAGMNGKFTSNVTDAGRMWVVAYLTHNSFYTIERADYTVEELISEMKRYDVKYYLFESENNKTDISLNEDIFRFVFKGNGYDLYELR